MNAEFLYMMYLAGCGAQAVSPVPPEQAMRWERVLQYASEQFVDDLVCYAVTLAEFELPAHIRELARQKVRRSATANTMRRMGLQRVLENCKRVGLKVAIIKGYAVSDDYASPEIRTSADIDLFVSEEEEEKALLVFVANGFIHRGRTPEAKDTILFHPMVGHVELHIRYFEQLAYRLWYKDVDISRQAELVEKETEAGAYYALEITDHLLFVMLHMMKHFIGGGCSLKMLLDIGMMLKAHTHEINYQRLRAVLEGLQYTKAMQAFIYILCKYCGLDIWRNPLAGEGGISVADELVEDMEKGGALGKKDESHTSANGRKMYNAAALKRQTSAAQYRLQLLTDGFMHFPRAVFPKRKSLQLQYGYLFRRPWLYPVAWGSRAVRMCKKYILPKGKRLPNVRTLIDAENAAQDAGKDRFLLFQKMNML